ncbi:MAG: zf-HC2 domain-containing protein [Solirubrobacterales bacterium]
MSTRAGETITCREFVELVTDYLEGRLPESECERFEDHLALCPGCQAYVEQMRATLRALGRIPEESISPAAREELLHAFRTWKATR